MDFDLEFVTKSNYTDLHKGKPVKFANIAGSRQDRMDERLKERRSTRYDNYLNNRVIIDDGIPLSPYSEVQSPAAPPPTAELKAMQRKKDLQQWLAEKKKRKADLIKTKVKPFVVPVVHSTLVYKPPSPLKKGKQKSVAVSDRITRSRKDARRPTRPNIVKTLPTKPNTVVKSFAPQNAQFHAPKVLSSYLSNRQPTLSINQDPLEPAKQRKSFEKAKLVNGQAGRILRNRQTQTSLNKPEIVKQNKKKQKLVNGLLNKPLDRPRKSLRNEEAITLCDTYSSSNGNCNKKPDAHHVTPVKRSVVPKSESLSEEKLKTPPMQMAIDHTLSAISPFVTMSRGKDKALREARSKMVDGMFADDVCDEKSTQHFRNQLDGEIGRLQQICKEWDDYKEANSGVIPDNHKELIFQACCQTNLLITNKFEQFRGLIDRCDVQQMVEGEGAVTLQDLQGFWDMVFIQVDNIELRFKKLRDLKANNWAQEDIPAVNNKKPVANKAKKKKTLKNTEPSCLRAMIDAARKAAKENKSLPPEEAQRLIPMKAFNAELLKAQTPVKNKEPRSSVTPARNTSMLKSVLSSEARRLSVMKSTPTSMAMLRASYISKCVTGNKKIDGEFTPQAVSEVKLDATPGRSILKVTNTATKDSSRAEGKKSLKVVLFTSDDKNAGPAIGSLEDGIVPIERDSEIPLITNRLEVITMDTLQEIPSKRRGRKKLTKQKAIEQESIENQEPRKEKQNTHTVTEASPPRRMTRNMRRRTLSMLENDSIMPSAEFDEDVVMTPKTPRGRGRTKKMFTRKQSIGDLIDLNTPDQENLMKIE